MLQDDFENVCRCKSGDMVFTLRKGWFFVQKKKKMNWGLFLLAVPGLIFLLAFYYAPLFGLIIPFKRIDYSKGIFQSDWCGFDNFEFFLLSGCFPNYTQHHMLKLFIYCSNNYFVGIAGIAAV